MSSMRSVTDLNIMWVMLLARELPPKVSQSFSFYSAVATSAIFLNKFRLCLSLYHHLTCISKQVLNAGFLGQSKPSHLN